MTKRININKCRRCVHYNGTMCVLEDLAPCRFRRTPEAENERAKDIFLVVAFFVAVLFCVLLWLAEGRRVADQQPAPEAENHWSAVELLKEYHGQKDGLTEWEKLQLAIILTESKGNPDAVGKDGDYGLYQMRECFVEEVNRISGSNYSHEDAFDMDNAIDMFNRLQSHYNSEKDIEKAIAYHNHGSAYRATVLRNLELVERMEVVRQKLIEYER